MGPVESLATRPNRYTPSIPERVGQELPQVGSELPQGGAGATPGVGSELPPNSTENSTENSITSVFDHWVTERRRVLGTKRTVPMKATQGRLSKIRARLEEGYSVAELKRAVDGCLGHAFNVENGHVDIELICRDQKHVEQNLSRADKSPADGGSAPFGSGAARIV